LTSDTPNSETDRTLGITAGDFNGDGVLDIVAGNFATTNKMHFGVLSGT
jgi:hypothetical protein